MSLSESRALRKHLLEAVIFAGVGVTATVTHYVVALLMVESVALSVYWANIVAYCCAVFVSFFGHSMITFKKALSLKRAITFLVASLSALGLSELLLWVLQSVATLGHRVEFLVVVLFIPAYSYLVNKFWVYR